MNPGGRGQLSKYFILDSNYQSNVFYDVGSWTYNTNTKFQMNSLPLLEAFSGYQSEIPPYTNYFGGIGGNVIQNSLDLYEKSIPENGFVKVAYAGPSQAQLNFRTLEISTSGLQVLQDETGGTISGNIINKMLVQNETDVYYRILDRTKELDLEESTLNGIPLISGDNIKYEEPAYTINSYDDVERMLKGKYSNNEMYITELDNHRRKLTFKTPLKSNDENNLTNIKLDLKVTDRKFYFAITRDNNIDTVKINGILFHPNDPDKNDFYKRRKKRDEEGNAILDKDSKPIYYDDYGFVAGESLEMEVTFKNETVALLKEAIPNYLNDCLAPYSISKSNNYIQTINPFIMPERDVLLFLKTEQTYILKIFKNEDSFNIIDITHENDSVLPIIKRHFWDDRIVIEVMFTGQHLEIDREHLKNQLSDVDDIRFNELDRPYERNVGYDILIPQTVTFLMPARDVTLYIKEKDYRQKLTIRSYNKKTDDNNSLNDDEPNHFNEINVNDEAPNRELYESGDQNFPLEQEYLYMVRDYINIKVFFDENYQYYELDREFMVTQLMTFNKIEDKEFVGERPRIPFPAGLFNSKEQEINFEMPNQDLVLVIKESTIKRILTIKADPYQYRYEEKKIQKIVYKDMVYPAGDDILPGEKEEPGVILDTIVEGQIVDLYVKFQDIRMKLDGVHFYGQLIPEQIYEPGDFITSPIITDNKELYQKVTFGIPNTDFTLYLKWAARIYLFTVEYSISVITSARYTIIRDGKTKDGYFNGTLSLYYGDELTVTLEYAYPNKPDPKSECTVADMIGYEEVPLEGNPYFDFSDNEEGTITITYSTTHKKEVSIILDFIFGGIKKFFSLLPGFLSNISFNLTTEKTAKIIAWGGGPRGFFYTRDVTMKPGEVKIKTGNGAPGGAGGFGSEEDGSDGSPGYPWSSIIYTNRNGFKQQTIILGEGGFGGGVDEIGIAYGGAGNPSLIGNYLAGLTTDAPGGWITILPIASPGSPSDFEEIESPENKLGSELVFQAAFPGAGVKGGGGLVNHSNPNGGCGAPSCGGAGEGGEGRTTARPNVYEDGKYGGVLDPNTLIEGTDHIHVPLYLKGDKYETILNELNTIDGGEWGASITCDDTAKGLIMALSTGVYLSIPEDPEEP